LPPAFRDELLLLDVDVDVDVVDVQVVVLGFVASAT
jgi:hypothetical protein